MTTNTDHAAWAYDPQTHSVLEGDMDGWRVVATVSNDDDGYAIAALGELLNVVELVLRGSETWYVPGDIVDRMKRAVALAKQPSQ